MFILAALTSVHVLERSSICTRVLVADLQHDRVALKTFIKRTREEKELLKSDDFELYAKINSVWELRKMHMMSSLPSQYLCYLRCMLLPT